MRPLQLCETKVSLLKAVASYRTLHKIAQYFLKTYNLTPQDLRGVIANGLIPYSTLVYSELLL
jgi:hypothetical protein